MPVYKIIKSGNNLEIYEYEHDVGFNPTDVEERKEPGENKETKDRTEERRKQTLRENAMNLKRMAREHFQGKCFFVTLTFKENMQDIDKADRKLKYFIKKLKEMYGDVSWMAVRELQERGAIHYHMLLKNDWLRDYYIKNIPKAIKRGNKTITSEQQKEFERYIHKEFWKHGWVNFTLLDFVDDVGAYLAKYMMKGNIKDQEWQENRRLILKSKDIKKVSAIDSETERETMVKILKYLEHIKSIAKEDIINNQNKKRVFTNGYNSEFVGQVNYYEVHLERIENWQEVFKEIL